MAGRGLGVVAVEEMQAAVVSGDTFYAHTDEEAATANPFFPRRVAHGNLRAFLPAQCRR